MQSVRRFTLFSIVVCTLAVPACLSGQSSQKILRNQDVIDLETAGLADDTILLAIRNSKTAFDTSPSAIIALSKAGIHKVVLNAMIEAAHSRSVKTAEVQSDLSVGTSGSLSEAFSHAALKALSSVAGEMGRPSMLNGGVTVPRRTQEAIDEASSLALTPEEQQVVKGLNDFYLVRLKNNMARELFSLKFYGPQAEVRASQAMASDAGMQALAKGEAGCSNSVDQQIRAGHVSGIPKECSEPTELGSMQPTGVVEQPIDPPSVMKKVVDALGGEKRLAEIASYREIDEEGTEVLVVFPDKVRISMSKGKARQIITMTTQTSDFEMSGKHIPLPPQFRDEARRIGSLGILNIAKNASDGEYHVSATSRQRIDGKDIEALSISNPSGKVIWYVDTDTGRLLKVTRQGILPSGAIGEVTVTYSDWRSVQGVNLPMTGTIEQPVASVHKTIELEFNPETAKSFN
jgi:hypothetical protein